VTTFVLIAAAMVAVALAWILVPLLRGHPDQRIDREASNVALLRDQLQELENDVANGIMPTERFDQARRELEARVLEESKATAPVATATSRAGVWSAAIVGAVVPIAAVVLYLLLGDPAAFSPQAREAAAKADGGHDVTPAQVEEMVTKLTAKLEKEPANVEGWVVLARTYYYMRRFPEAAKAFEKAVGLAPDAPDLLADYADTLGAAQGGTLEGKPLELVNRALKIDPTYWKALALAGTAAFNRKDYRQAVDYWERLKPTVPPESDIARSIDASIAEARTLGNLPAAPAAVPGSAVALAPAPAARAPAAPSTSAAAPAAPAMPGTAITGTVKLAPAIAAKASPNDVVFVFARAAEGPKMPLAILRLQVKDLPTSFTLDDSMAMTPTMKVSSFPEVVAGARISKSGSAAPAPGDLEGLSKPLKPGTTGVSIVIDSVLP
jgi:cytochrome c-type biogenesis protein CcmH